MPVVKATISTALQALYTTAKASPMSDADFADGLAQIIMDAIQSGTVQSGITVQVTPATGTGATTGTGTIL